MSLARTIMIIGGTMSQRLGNVVLLPIVIASMSAAEFARFGLFTSAVAVLVPALTMNLHMSIGRMYFDHQTDEARASAHLSSLAAALLGLLVGSGLLMAILDVFGIEDPLAFGDLRLQFLILLCTVLLVLMQSGAILSRVRDQSMIFALASTMSGFGLLAGYIFFEWRVEDKLLALVYAYIFAQGGAWLCTSPMYFYSLKHGALCRGYVRPAFAYASGATIYVVSTWVIAQAGRWVGGFTLTEAEAAGYTLISYGMVVLGVLINAYAETRRIPFLTDFSAGRVDAALKTMSHVTRRNFMLVVAAYVVGVLVIFFKDWLLPQDYDVRMIWLLPAFAYSVAGVLFNRAFWFFGALKKTWWLAGVTSASAAAYLCFIMFFFDATVSVLLWGSAVMMAVQAASLLLLANWQVRRHVAQMSARGGVES